MAGTANLRHGARGRRRATRAARLGKIRARKARRTELIARTLQDAEPHEVTHEWISQRTGIPLGYLTWRFPDVSDLRSLV